jgi:hypothetical protein
MLKSALFSLLAAISMLLFAAVVADWIRSYWVEEAAGLARYWHQPSTDQTV